MRGSLSGSRECAEQTTKDGRTGHEHNEDHGDDDASLSSHFFPPFKQRVCSPTHAGAVARLDSGLTHGVTPLARRIVAQERERVGIDDLPRHLDETFEREALECSRAQRRLVCDPRQLARNRVKAVAAAGKAGQPKGAIHANGPPDELLAPGQFFGQVNRRVDAMIHAQEQHIAAVIVQPL